MGKVKVVINVQNQNEYNEALTYFKSKDKQPYFAGEITNENIFEIYGCETCMKISEEKIFFGATSQYKNNFDFKVIDFNDFTSDQTIERYEGTETGIVSNRLSLEKDQTGRGE